jgi:hypothetical protein
MHLKFGFAALSHTLSPRLVSSLFQGDLRKAAAPA